MAQRSVILGVWTNLPTRKLEHFLASIISSRFDGNVVLFVHGLALETMRDLNRYGVETRDAGPYIRQDISIQTSRYMMYLDFLLRGRRSYENVMLTDVRDVILQADPFLAPLVGDVVFAMERVEIGTCGYNSTWASDAYGPQYLRQVRHLPVSCSGTTFGTADGIIRYLSLMVREILASHTKVFKSQRGIDQGFHARIVHFHPPDGAYCDHEDRLAATLAYLPDAAIRVVDDKILVDDRVVPVVHQWDRKKSVSDLVTTHPRYRLGGRETAGLRLASRNSAPEDLVMYVDDGTFPEQTWNFALATLRASGFDGRIICLTTQSVTKGSDLSTKFGCEVVYVPTRRLTGPALPLITCAHWLRQVNDHDFGKTIFLDSPDFIFISNPFPDMQHRLEFHAEGGGIIGDCQRTIEVMERSGGDVASFNHRYIANPSAISGVFDYVRSFFDGLHKRLFDHADDLAESVSVRSLFNLHAYAGDHPFPSAVMPNGALVLSRLANEPALVEFVPTFRYNKIRPAIIQSPCKHEYLRTALKFEIPAELWKNQGETQQARQERCIREGWAA